MNRRLIYRFGSGLAFSILALGLAYISFRMVVPSEHQFHWARPFHYYGVVKQTLCGWVLLGLAGAWWVHRSMLTRISARAARWTLGGMALLFALLQVGASWALRVTPSWDFVVILKAAQEVALGLPIANTLYFDSCPRNIFASVYVGAFLSAGGGEPAFDGMPYVLNGVSILVSVVGGVYLAWKQYGAAVALLFMIVSLLSAPLFLYAPIVYTDTLALPYVALTLCAWERAREAEQHGRWPDAIRCWIWVGVMAGVGYLIKQLLLFVWLGVLGVSLLAPVAGGGGGRRVKAQAVAWVACIVVFIAVIGGWSACQRRFLAESSRLRAFPASHFIMMGLNTPEIEDGTSYGYGAYSEVDERFTRALHGNAEKTRGTMRMIRERLQAFGVLGYSRFLLKKMEWTWTDGTFYALEKIRRQPVHDGEWHRWLLRDNQSFLRATSLVHASVLLLMLAGVGFNLIRRPDDPFFLCLAVICLGVMVFLLVWETRSRYLVLLIPVFNLMAARGLDLLSMLPRRPPPDQTSSVPSKTKAVGPCSRTSPIPRAGVSNATVSVSP